MDAAESVVCVIIDTKKGGGRILCEGGIILRFAVSDICSKIIINLELIYYELVLTTPLTLLG